MSDLEFDRHQRANDLAIIAQNTRRGRDFAFSMVESSYLGQLGFYEGMFLYTYLHQLRNHPPEKAALMTQVERTLTEFEGLFHHYLIEAASRQYILRAFRQLSSYLDPEQPRAVSLPIRCSAKVDYPLFLPTLFGRPDVVAHFAHIGHTQAANDLDQILATDDKSCVNPPPEIVALAPPDNDSFNLYHATKLAGVYRRTKHKIGSPELECSYDII